MKPLVYLAGPITIPDPMENCHRAFKLATCLRDSGLVVPFVPHTTCIWHMVDPAGYEDWLAYDFEIIRHCDALVHFEGASSGADREVAHATSCKLPVFWIYPHHDGQEYDGIGALYEWARTQ
jgi:Domain of unknown function (DUF4406)